MTTARPEKLKIGIIGTGSISLLHLWAINQASEKVKLAAACDVREDAVRQFAMNAGLDTVYTDAATMLKEADIDAVDICASHQWHRELAIASAEAGKHILLEKPMAISMQECRDILAAADKAGVTLMIGQQLRHNPNYIAVRRLIQEGALGQVWGLRSDSWLPVIMSRSVTNDQFAQNELLKWRIDKNQSGGGSLIWNAIHFIDLFRYFIGNAKRVFAKCWTDHPIFSGGAEDRVMATIEFDNGAVGHISNSWTTRAPWQFQFMILGTEGSIYTPVNPSATSIEQHEAPAVVSCPRHDIADARSRGGLSRPFVPIDLPEGLFSNNPYVNEFAHFADCCRSGQEPISSGRDNLGTMKIVFGIYEASRRGQMVDLTDL
jgi:myo-inositol 2-dehydrogenase/D-chiro-inositol 1-dehydrogenase